MAIDMVPKKWWNLDLLSTEGEARMREVVAHVHQMCGTQ